MVTIKLFREVKKRRGAKITDIKGIDLNLNLELIGKNKELFNNLNYNANQILAYYEKKALENYEPIQAYKVSSNPYKKQIYINGKYILSVDKTNVDQLERDYNLFRAMNIVYKDILEILKTIYKV